MKHHILELKPQPTNLRPWIREAIRVLPITGSPLFPSLADFVESHSSLEEDSDWLFGYTLLTANDDKG